MGSCSPGELDRPPQRQRRAHSKRRPAHRSKHRSATRLRSVPTGRNKAPAQPLQGCAATRPAWAQTFKTIKPSSLYGIKVGASRRDEIRKINTCLF